MTNDHTLLEQFLINNPDLQRLESLLDEFNLFEAIGAVRSEVRHSDFLAFLLDPRQSHGLGDAFAKRFLQGALMNTNRPEDLAISSIDIHLSDLNDLEVRREWQNIDLLLLSDQSNLAIVIENKVYSGEHSEQLRRYREFAENQFPRRKRLYILLTPDGVEPNDENYLIATYTTVCEILEDFLETRQAALGPDVAVTIRHYTQMLRRNIVSGSEIPELVERIYRQHKRAIDLIFENRLDEQSVTRDFLHALLTDSSQFIIDQVSKNHIGFAPKAWEVPVLRVAENGADTGRILHFNFENYPTSLKLKLTIGPGPLEVRQKLLDMALNNHPPFKSAYRALNRKWNNILSDRWLEPKHYKEDTDERHLIIKDHWERFLGQQLPAMTEVLRKDGWLA